MQIKREQVAKQNEEKENLLKEQDRKLKKNKEDEFNY